MNTIKLVAIATIIVALIGAFFVVDRRAYERGSLDTAQRLHNATLEAAGELSDAAEARRLIRRQCLASGGMPILATGECEFGSTDPDNP